ncbi:MAG: hypothetical protein PHR53_02505 [Bacteroidales bacterium]|nr:hypothetical protein [Bacteroidales bacterium]
MKPNQLMPCGYYVSKKQPNVILQYDGYHRYWLFGKRHFRFANVETEEYIPLTLKDLDDLRPYFQSTPTLNQ